MADNTVRLEWTGEGLSFRGGAPDGPHVAVDGDGEAGPSPMTQLLLALAGCMGIDVVMILQKGRVPLTGLSVAVDGDRAADAPRRFTAIRMTYEISGPGPDDAKKVDRAVELSRDRYCSVLHSLGSDIDLDIQVEVS